MISYLKGTLKGFSENRLKKQLFPQKNEDTIKYVFNWRTVEKLEEQVIDFVGKATNSATHKR